MTFVSFSVSMLGMWVRLLFVEVGIQWRHSKYTVPYVHLTVWRTALLLSWQGVILKTGKVQMVKWRWINPLCSSTKRNREYWA